MPLTNKKFFLSQLILLACFVILILFLYLVFSGRFILPQSFNLGPLVVHYYGIIMALAVLLAWLVAKRRAVFYNINLEKVDDILFWLAIGGFIGARLYHVASSFPYYSKYPVDVFKVWNGGLSIYGAGLGGVFVLFLFAKNYKLNMLSLLDWLVPSLLIGQIIGRFGNFFNYEAFGYPTNLPWKMFVPIEFRPQNYSNFTFFHPFFLYEVIGNLIILVIVLNFYGSEHAKRRAGQLFFLYLLLYNILRFSLEFLRVDSTFIGLVRLNSVTSLVLVLISFIVVICTRKNVKIL